MNRNISSRSASVPVNLDKPQSEGKRSSVGNSKQKWGLINVKSLPNFLNDNEYLLDNHRPELNSAKECLKSAFVLHTETWNIWTHLLGSVASIFLSIYYAKYISTEWQQTLSFSVFFFGAVFCMGASAVYHAFICHSEPVCKLLAKMDYVGVILLITTSYIPWLQFAFYCDNIIKLFYMTLVGVLAAGCISVVVQDKFREPCYRWLRLGLFAFLGLTGLVPGIHFIISHHALQISSALPVIWLIVMAVLYLTGGLAYASQIPERLFPGKFDIWCQSHQILHICVMGGVLTCYQGAASLASARLDSPCFNV
jgi:adiponectin receptor